MIIALIICAILVGIDQYTKFIALTKLKPIETMKFIDKILDFTFVENRGAAFGILQGKRWFFVIITVLVVAVIIYAFLKTPKEKEFILLRCSLVIILAGALGNFIDRFFRGYVIDFLEIKFIKWPVFNVADMLVVIGAVCLAIFIIFVKEEPIQPDDDYDEIDDMNDRL